MAAPKDMAEVSGVAYAQGAQGPAPWFGLDGGKPGSAKPPRLAAPHAGHRERLRARAAISFDALPDYELLELILARSSPRGDVKPMAKALLARFGGLAGVLGAGLEELKGV